MFLTGRQIHFVFVIVHADVDDVGQKLLVTWNHLQLLVQALWEKKKKTAEKASDTNQKKHRLIPRTGIYFLVQKNFIDLKGK